MTITTNWVFITNLVLSILVKERIYDYLVTMFNRVLAHMFEFVISIKLHNLFFCSLTYKYMTRAANIHNPFCHYHISTPRRSMQRPLIKMTYRESLSATNAYSNLYLF